MPAKIQGINIDDLIQRHLSGESVNKIAQSLGIARITINRWFAQNGFVARNHSESESIKWSLMTPEQRQKQVKAAHNAIIGKAKDNDLLKKTAKTREQTKQYIGKGELELKKAIEKKGISVIAQKAFDRYNIDLAINDSVAVEVFFCATNPLSRKNDSKKIVELLKKNWLVIYIIFSPTADILMIDFNYIASIVDMLSRDPSIRGKYFVIRANGKLDSPFGYDLNQVSRILASKNSINR